MTNTLKGIDHFYAKGGIRTPAQKLRWKVPREQCRDYRSASGWTLAENEGHHKNLPRGLSHTHAKNLTTPKGICEVFTQRVGFEPTVGY